MSSLRIGRRAVHWCCVCNIPLLEKRCGSCDSLSEDVVITPPGDIRPGFSFDREIIIKVTDAQFGEGSGEALLPSDRVFLLNRAPAEDRMDEIVMDGGVIASVRYRIPGGWQVIPRSCGASRIASVADRGIVVADPGAVGPVLDGKNLLAPGILEVRGDHVAGDEVLVVDTSGNLFAGGSLRQDTPHVVGGRGQGVKIRWRKMHDGEVCENSIGKASEWDAVVEANKCAIERLEKRGAAFVKKTMAQNHELPVAVSVSGGKDSLATLLVVMAAGVRPRLLFLDTGLEFQETVDNVRACAEEHGLELLVEEAGDAFWQGLETFGPPAKDFRWCCKTCKLGPATRLINKNFPKGVLSFIGQRKYESEQRSKKGRVWRNPWVPNQIGASPIQDWSALHVWMYIFFKGAAFNPLYEKGLHRIGCWLCPGSDMGDSDMVRDIHPHSDRWEIYLKDYRSKHGLPEEWQKYGMWRWKKTPLWAVEAWCSKQDVSKGEQQPEACPLVVFAPGYESCSDSLSAEGAFTRPLDMSRLANTLNMLGCVKESKEEGWIETRGSSWSVQVYHQGGIVLRAETEEGLEELKRSVLRLLLRSELCLGCGVCIGSCPNGALRLEDGKAKVGEECNHCGSCMERCPVSDFEVVGEWEG